MKQWAIFDWAGNRIKSNKTFESFEDAWDYIMGELTDEIGLVDEDYQEFHVSRLK